MSLALADGKALVRGRRIPIDFHKEPRGRYHSVLHRADGVSVGSKAAATTASAVRSTGCRTTSRI